MSEAMRAALGSFVLILGLAGCADISATSPATSPVTTAQHECERSGGVWRGTLCERSGGGGY